MLMKPFPKTVRHYGFERHDLCVVSVIVLLAVSLYQRCAMHCYANGTCDSFQDMRPPREVFTVIGVSSLNTVNIFQFYT